MFSGKFLQSKEWAEFQESLGRKTWRIDDVLVIKIPLKFGLCYLYSPKISEIRIHKLEIRIKDIAEKERAVFLRIEPQEAPPRNFIKTKDVQPACTLILNLTKSEEKLLAEMYPKTRYNIRLAERKGVKILPTPPLLPFPTPSNSHPLQLPLSKGENRSGRGRKGRNEEGFDKFYNLLKQTSDRQKIRLHSENYYRELAKFNKIFIAYYQNEPVAGAMVNFHESIATYLHGGTSMENTSVMAPYLLHWEIIKYAKAAGIKHYDWWGADEQKWPGVTRFKTGFGGEKVCAPGAFDLPLDKFWYFIYTLFRR